MEILRTILLYLESRNVPFLVIGGHAVNAFGISRQTGDLDLLVKSSDRTIWLELMKKLDYLVGQQDQAFARFRPASIANWPINLMFVDDQTFEKIWSEAVEENFGPGCAKVASAKHLAMLKMHALSTFQEHRYSKDLSDLVSLLKSGMTGLALEDVEKLCLKYATRELFDKLKGEIG